MIWLDYFLQLLANALAWSLSVGVTLVLIGWGLWEMARRAMDRRP